MPRFTYKAIDESGNTVNGVLEADTKEMAENLLVQKGLIPSIIRGEGESKGISLSLKGLSYRFGKIKDTDLILFTKQFRTMLHSGIPIINAFKIMEYQAENPLLKRVSGQIVRDLQEGSSLYEAFKRHPKVFSSLYCEMIKAGETSGNLVDVLDRLIYIIEHEHKVRSDIRSALQYPIVVTVFLAVAFFILLTFVVPKFINIFIRAGLELPLPTKICMVLYNFLASYWYAILTAIIVGILLTLSYFKTEKGRLLRDTQLLRIPVLGPLFIKAAMSRFASIFAILQASGIGILDSFEILSGIIGNSAISKEFISLKAKVQEGQGISDPLKSSRYFTPMVINMIAIGEESGRLDDMLKVIAAHYDEEMAYQVNRLSEAIGPVLTVGLAGVIGFFALAIFLPMWDLTKMVRPM